MAAFLRINMSKKIGGKLAVRALAATPSSGNTPDPNSMQGYMDRLIKLIPAEVVGIYMVGVGVIPADQKIVFAIWAALCLIFVFIIRYSATRDATAKIPAEWGSIVISAVSFVIWIYNMQGPFQAYGLAVPYIGSLAVLAWTFLVPIVYKGQAVN